MSITTITIFSKQNRSSGTFTSSTVTLPTNVTSINSVRLYIDSTNNQGVIQYNLSSETLSIKGQFSLDGGSTWQDDFSFDSQGGYVNHQGVPTDPEATVYYGSSNPLPPGARYKVIAVQVGSFRWGLNADIDAT